jgi:hypothetical protein
MPDRSRVMTQTKRDTMVIQVGGLAWGYQPHTVKYLIVMKVKQRKKLERFKDDGQKRTKYSEITLATWNIQTM